jgi:hypothetical protein
MTASTEDENVNRPEQQRAAAEPNRTALEIEELLSRVDVMPTQGFRPESDILDYDNRRSLTIGVALGPTTLPLPSPHPVALSPSR